MEKSLTSQVTAIYKSSNCPVIVTDLDYAMLGANESAITFFGIQKMSDITRLAKNQIGDNPSGAFVYNGDQYAYVETVTQDSESVRVIHVTKNLLSSDVNAVFRSTVVEMHYRRTMARIFQNLDKLGHELGDLAGQTERDMYSIFALLQTTVERYKCENGLRTHADHYFDITDTMSSVLTQINMVTQVLGMNVVFDFENIKCAVAKGDKEGFAQAVIKLVRGICRFSEDKTVRVSSNVNEDIIEFVFSVKSKDMLNWQEKNLDSEDLLEVLQHFDRLQDGILLTDAICELKYEGAKVTCEQAEDETHVLLNMPFEEMSSHRLNSLPLRYIGDQFSSLTVLFTPLETE